MPWILVTFLELLHYFNGHLISLRSFYNKFQESFAMPFELTIDEESQPLTRRLSPSQFQQQGQVDWVNLSRSTIHFSLGVLSRLSAASVDPYTVTVGHFVGSAFQFSTKGRQDVETAIFQLKAFGSVGNVLWFGFGIRDIVRNISVTEQGAMLVALCGVLGECFPDDNSAEILSEILKRKGNFETTPAVSQWRSLVRSCSGIFTATPFPLRAETLMGMQLEKPLRPDIPLVDSPSIADALIGVGNVSLGLWNSITIIGPREAGWIAAVAEWLFGLSVTITDEEGCLKHSSCSGGEAQVQVLFMTREPAIVTAGTVQVTEKTYYLQATRDLFQAARDPLETMVTPLSGRVKWENALSTCFDDGFKKIMEMETTIGEIIGSAARIFEAIAFAEPGVPDKVLCYNLHYSDESFGKAFVKKCLSTFPELSKASSSMHKSCVNSSFLDALAKYQARLSLLAATCGCAVCERRDTARMPGSTQCHVLLVETIIQICRLSAILEVPEPVYPLLRGFQKAYNAQDSKRTRARNLDFESVGVLQHILNVAADGQTKLEDALRLFTGRTFASLDEDIRRPCAVSAGGVCLYIGSLREVSDRRELVNRIYVVPGRIEYHQRPFFYIEERLKRSMHFSMRLKADIWQCLESKAVMSEVKPIIHETTKSLSMEYEIIDEKANGTNIIIGPLSLVVGASRSRGNVHCEHHYQQDGKAENTLPESVSSQLDDADVSYRNLEAPLLGRCAALSSSGFEYGEAILRDEECLPCCVTTALRKDLSRILILSSKAPSFLVEIDPCNVVAG